MGNHTNPQGPKTFQQLKTMITEIIGPVDNTQVFAFVARTEAEMIINTMGINDFAKALLDGGIPPLNTEQAVTDWLGSHWEEIPGEEDYWYTNFPSEIKRYFFG